VLLTQLLRNAPWLVVVFLVMNLLPFEFQALDRWWQIPDWLKAALGLGLAGSGYVSEIVRGGIRSIPVAQWEAAASLALPRRKSLRLVILPQALRSMVPPWMSLYCAVTMATSLANLMGVEELMTSLQLRLTGQTRPDLLLPAYLYVFVAFFIYIYPISRYSRYLERKWSLYS
jgi:polar amino acid transport system permease protein